jgi:hypothetical protein
MSIAASLMTVFGFAAISKIDLAGTLDFGLGFRSLDDRRCASQRDTGRDPRRLFSMAHKSFRNIFF